MICEGTKKHVYYGALSQSLPLVSVALLSAVNRCGTDDKGQYAIICK